jgi:hypothetical protein
MSHKRTQPNGAPLDPLDAEIVALRRAGRSVRGIAAALKKSGRPLGKTRVAARLSRLQLEGVSLPRSRPSARKGGQRTNGARVIDAPHGGAHQKTSANGGRRMILTPDSLADLGGAPPLATDIPADSGDPDIDATRLRLRRVSSAINAHWDAALRGEFNFSTIVSLIRCETDLVDRVVNHHTLPSAASGESDAARAVDAAEVRREIATAVTAAEQTIRCAHCGANPFQPDGGKVA